MAFQIEIDPEEHRPGLYDSADGTTLMAEKVVDITDDCPARERTLLLYTKAKRGPIVQVAHPYDGQSYLGSTIHFFTNEMDARDESFAMTARRAGLTGFQFRKLIRQHAPVVPNGHQGGEA